MPSSRRLRSHRVVDPSSPSSSRRRGLQLGHPRGARHDDRRALEQGLGRQQRPGPFEAAAGPLHPSASSTCWAPTGTSGARSAACPIGPGSTATCATTSRPTGRSSTCSERTGNLWREVSSMTVRSLVASGVSGFQAATDGSGFVYYLDGRSSLWLQRPTGSPQILASSVLGFQAPGGLTAGSLYVLRADRTLWARVARLLVTPPHRLERRVVLGERRGGRARRRDQLEALVRELHVRDAQSRRHERRVLQGVRQHPPRSSKTTASTSGAKSSAAHNRDAVDVGNVKAFVPVAKDSVYVLDLTGNLWLETLADPACNYTLSVAPQAGLYVDAWGIQTKSGACPVIATATGTWSNMVNGYIPNVPTKGLWVPPTPTCAGRTASPQTAASTSGRRPPGRRPFQDPSACSARPTRRASSRSKGPELACPVNAIPARRAAAEVPHVPRSVQEVGESFVRPGKLRLARGGFVPGQGKLRSAGGSFVRPGEASSGGGSFVRPGEASFGRGKLRSARGSFVQPGKLSVRPGEASFGRGELRSAGGSFVRPGWKLQFGRGKLRSARGKALVQPGNENRAPPTVPEPADVAWGSPTPDRRPSGRAVPHGGGGEPHATSAGAGPRPPLAASTAP